MAIATTEPILDQLGELIRLEYLGEKLLERASRHLSDPREVAHLWALATEYRDHARILRRHRREIDRNVPDIEYPRWARGRGPTPVEALEQVAEVTRRLAGEYRSSLSLHDNAYLRKFLSILAAEHDSVAELLTCLVNGKAIFFELEETTTE
jgi:hypothetical protein